jgi:hypothetical protein
VVAELVRFTGPTISPTFIEKMASSMGLVSGSDMSPLVRGSSLPPLSAEPGSCEYLRASSANFEGAAFSWL